MNSEIILSRSVELQPAPLFTPTPKAARRGLGRPRSNAYFLCGSSGILSAMFIANGPL
jgi:hypothetical protein